MPAAADVFDALTSKRVYKDAFSHSMAKAIILKDAGTHFSQQIVDAFLATEACFIEIRERYRDREHDLPLAAVSAPCSITSLGSVDIFPWGDG